MFAGEDEGPDVSLWHVLVSFYLNFSFYANYKLIISVMVMADPFRIHWYIGCLGSKNSC